jgi:hypothetical protein
VSNESENIAAQASIFDLDGVEENDYAKDFTLLFSVRVQKDASRFVIPPEVRNNFDWTSMREVGLVIFSDEEECRFCGVQPLKPGPEVYEVDMKCLIPGERIYIHAFQPPPKHRR